MDDTLFTALADENRRRLLTLLATASDGDPPVRVPEDLLVSTPTSPETAVRLHHVHLPKLAAMGYVEWDPDSGTVRRGPAFEDLLPLLTVIHEHETAAGD
ncbi:DUF7344 domain-containing protein [Halobacterium jilantaiense]|nr:hypothetical protein [Halobacterium jilantaiense]